MNARPIPPHGTPARYLGTPRTGNRPPCKCRKCVNAHTKACALREAQRLAGRPPRVPTPPLTAHVHGLLDADMSRNSIAIAAGVSAAVVSHIARGYSPTTNRYIAEKVMSVTHPRATRSTELMSPIGAQRRLRALYLAGHGPIAISATSGQSDTTVVRTVGNKPTRITIATHNAICAAYLALAGQQGTSAKARIRATREGWRDRTYWEDTGRIDDPDFNPDAKETRLVQVAQDAWWLLRSGVDRKQIAARLGISRDYVDKAMREVPEDQVAA
jgi:hypothetical protein